MYCKISSESWLVLFGTLVAVLLRCCTTLHPYSGQGTPPMYGDYEAQRHWMEITTNLPVKDWYRNTTDNNLMVWGLDYPPLTAYHMYLCGRFARVLNENFTKLHESRGHESEAHKLFMRYTVLMGDMLIFIPGIILYYYTCVNLRRSDEKKNKKKPKALLGLKIMDYSLSIVLGLLYPGIILIDHGHFQYNSISLGLFVFATIFLLHRKNILASIAFCLALNYKQMELYHSLPFFLYLLSTCVPKPGQSSLSGVLQLIKLGVSVTATFTLIWLPFLFNSADLLQVLHRLFPIARGVFEDKVSNIWCTLNIFFKFKSQFDTYQMMRLCMFTTLSAILPSCADLFLRPNLRKFVLSLINCSLGFFLFSFQVHEKSILLVAIPVLLYFPYAPFVCFWFLCISIFSMIPLLIKDNLTVALIALTVFYAVSFRVSVEHAFKNMFATNEGLFEYYRRILDLLFNVESNDADLETLIKLTSQKMIKNRHALFALIFHLTIFTSLCGCVALFVAILVMEPPQKYPDLFPLLISVYSCVHFFGFFLYFNVKQFGIPQEFEDIKNVKVKSS
ncbi:dolichyl pyrophosphate Man9GlcNAc2 alpha-1,3-glucosyltransferase [Cylas formicarius]|uniref:dolichyl pyrophosphate Man9GlcNAc2 alpha-1,3-glucosyltransferase n=1 Tax=Cylas formicarius TaxID=197179 RepID=UPI002958D8AD|nr:dolichyl pyrophosphate Man9GlcNAc2 alpha-1,3-glucosyltransferase [Cylas formicarius]